MNDVLTVLLRLNLGEMKKPGSGHNTMNASRFDSMHKILLFGSTRCRFFSSFYREKMEANNQALTPLSFIERAERVFRERTSIVYGSQRFSWSETAQRCRRLASVLTSSLDIKPGETVAVVAPNVPATYEMHFGVPMAGAVLSTLNIRLDASTMAAILEHSEAKALFVDYQYLEIAKAALRSLLQSRKKVPKLVIIAEQQGKLESTTGCNASDMEYENLLEEGNPNFEIYWPIDECEAITLNYTSGTTSAPKGVLYSHRGAYVNTLSTLLMWEMKSRPTFLWTIPMFHCNGWNFPWGIAAQGGTNICLRSVQAKEIFEAIDEHRVTHFGAAPTMLSILANAPPNERRPLPHRVHVMTGGSPLPPPLLSKIENMGFDITHIYGLTETYGPMNSCVLNPEWDLLSYDAQAKLRSRQGIPHVGVFKLDVKNPNTMEDVPHDGVTIGEVMVKSNTVMKGYYKDEEATSKAFEGGWFHTGDLGVIHPDGYLELKDRAKDVIISGGENISSIQVETVIHCIPFVAEVAVVGRPDDYWGETPCAFVKLNENCDAKPQEVIDYCRDHLPHYMAPRTVIFEDLPKTPTGKIQKHILREKAKRLGTIFPGNYVKH